MLRKMLSSQSLVPTAVCSGTPFLGGPGTDEGYGIVVDAADRLFVTGTSKSSWGTPIRAYCGEGDETRQGDAFVARLDVSGNLLWNTFLGSKYPDEGYAIDTDREGGVYVAGLQRSDLGRYGSLDD